MACRYVSPILSSACTYPRWVEGSHAQQPRAVRLFIVERCNRLLWRDSLSLESGITVQPPYAASRVVVVDSAQRALLGVRKHKAWEKKVRREGKGGLFCDPRASGLGNHGAP